MGAKQSKSECTVANGSKYKVAVKIYSTKPTEEGHNVKTYKVKDFRYESKKELSQKTVKAKIDPGYVHVFSLRKEFEGGNMTFTFHTNPDKTIKDFQHQIHKNIVISFHMEIMLSLDGNFWRCPKGINHHDRLKDIEKYEKKKIAKIKSFKKKKREISIKRKKMREIEDQNFKTVVLEMEKAHADVLNKIDLDHENEKVQLELINKNEVEDIDAKLQGLGIITVKQNAGDKIEEVDENEDKDLKCEKFSKVAKRCAKTMVAAYAKQLEHK